MRFLILKATVLSLLISIVLLGLLIFYEWYKQRNDEAYSNNSNLSPISKFLFYAFLLSSSIFSLSLTLTLLFFLEKAIKWLLVVLF